MTDLNISIPDDLEHFVESEAVANGYASPSDFVCAVIEALRHSKRHAEVEKTLLKRIDGPPAIEWTPEVWADLQIRVRQRLGRPV